MKLTFQHFEIRSAAHSMIPPGPAFGFLTLPIYLSFDKIPQVISGQGGIDQLSPLNSWTHHVPLLGRVVAPGFLEQEILTILSLSAK
jgi:hypothetical protein